MLSPKAAIPNTVTMRNDYVVHYFLLLCRGRVCAARTVCSAARRAPVVTDRECVRV